MKQRILIIEDDLDLCRLLLDNLVREGYEARACHDGCEGLREAKEGRYQLVILDLMLPLKNGYEVLAGIRESSVVPVLMLTAKDSEADKVAGLRPGADDYLTKPFGNSELLARVASLLRRYTVFNSGQAGNLLEFGSLMVNLSGREVTKEGVPLVLTAKEFDLLSFFAKNPGCGKPDRPIGSF